MKNILKKKIFSILIIISITLSVFFSLGLKFIVSNAESLYIQKELGDTDFKRFSITVSHGFLNGLDDKLIQELNNDKNIKNIYKLYTFSVPTKLNINFIGLDFTTDTLIFVISDNYYLEKHKNLNGLGISDKLIDIYNTNIGDSSKFFPSLDDKAIKLLNLNLEFGKSSFWNYDNSYQMKGKIELIGTDLPLLGISISKTLADKVISQIGLGKTKLYKIIGYTNDEDYINKIIEKYSSKFNIQYDKQIYLQIKNKIKNLEYILLTINGFVIGILIIFLIFIINSIIDNNQKTINIFKILGGSDYLGIKLILYEIIIYLITSILLSCGIFIIIQYYLSGIDLTKYIYGFSINRLGITEISIISLYYLGGTSLTTILIFLFKNKSV